MKSALVLVLIICCIASSFIITGNEDKPVPIPASIQRTGGDPKKGYEYLVTGDYVKSGLPVNIFRMANMGTRDYLQREGINSGISHAYTAVTAPNGEVVVAPNCLQCHAQVFDDKLIMGLGNTFIDFKDFFQQLKIFDIQPFVLCKICE